MCLWDGDLCGTIHSWEGSTELKTHRLPVKQDSVCQHLHQDAQIHASLSLEL